MGYSDVLSSQVLPSIVPPIFRAKDAVDVVLVPPYAFNGRYLCDATEISAAELKSLEHRQEVTMLPAPIAALKGYELWVDCDGQLRYQLRSEVRRQLDQISTQALAEARRAFAESQFAEAERYSSVALLASEQNLEAMAIKIAIAKIKRDANDEEILLELVAFDSKAAISALVEKLYNVYHQPSRVPHANVHSPMRGVATIRSYAA